MAGICAGSRGCGSLPAAGGGLAPGEQQEQKQAWSSQGSICAPGQGRGEQPHLVSGTGASNWHRQRRRLQNLETGRAEPSRHVCCSLPPTCMCLGVAPGQMSSAGQGRIQEGAVVPPFASYSTQSLTPAGRSGGIGSQAAMTVDITAHCHLPLRSAHLNDPLIVLLVLMLNQSSSPWFCQPDVCWLLLVAELLFHSPAGCFELIPMKLCLFLLQSN